MIRPISKDTHRHQTEAATTEHTLRLLGLHSNFRDFSDQVFDDAQSGCVSWEVGGQCFPPHAAPHSSLTGDCPDGFLHLLHVFGDVIDDNVTLQQTCEEFFSGDSLKRRATVPLCQLVDKGNWTSRRTDGLQIRSPPPPQDSHIWSICMSIKMKSWFSFACNSQVTKASLKTAWNVVWGDGSAGNAPASQARRPEFALHNLHKKRVLACMAPASMLGRWKREDSWGFPTSQPSLLGEQQANERPSHRRKTPSTVFWFPRGCACVLYFSLFQVLLHSSTLICLGDYNKVQDTECLR